MKSKIIKPVPIHDSHGKGAGWRGLIESLSGEMLGAIHDHRNWIDSDRARRLNTLFARFGLLLGYVAYLACAYLAVSWFLEIRNGLDTARYVVPVAAEGTRVALFNIMAIGLIGPLLLIAAAFLIGWIYNLTRSAAHRCLPRFMHTLARPAILLSVATVLAYFHVPVTDRIAISYLHIKANVEAALPREGATYLTELDAPVYVDQASDKITGIRIENDHELQRLKSMFQEGRPCLKKIVNPEALEQGNTEMPEPGLATEMACPDDSVSTRLSPPDRPVVR